MTQRHERVSEPLNGADDGKRAAAVRQDPPESEPDSRGRGKVNDCAGGQMCKRLRYADTVRHRYSTFKFAAFWIADCREDLVADSQMADDPWSAEYIIAMNTTKGIPFA